MHRKITQVSSTGCVQYKPDEKFSFSYKVDPSRIAVFVVPLEKC